MIFISKEYAQVEKGVTGELILLQPLFEGVF